jgi:STE24 endopeptidase
MWDHSLLVSNYLQIQGEIYQQIIFGAIFGLFNLILNLPFSLYYNFVLEEKHGFNKQTVALYFADLVKTIFLVGVIGGPTLGSFLWIIQWGKIIFVDFLLLSILIF